MQKVKNSIFNMYNKFLRHLIFSSIVLMFVIIVTYIYSQISPLQKIITLKGLWSISLDDLEEYSSVEVDDSMWKKIDIDDNVLLNTQKDLNKICWIRKKIYTGQENIKLTIRNYSGSIYLNGERIKNVIIINYEDNLPKEHVIAARMKLKDLKEFTENCSVETAEEILESGFIINKMQKVINNSSFPMFISLIILFSVVYYKKNGKDIYYFFCLQIVFGIPVIMEFFGCFNFITNPEIRLKIFALFWVAINVVHPAFLHRIYKFKRNNLEVALWIFFAIAAIMTLILNGNEKSLKYVVFLIIATILIGIYNITCHILALVRDSHDTRIFSVFGIIIISFILYDSIASLSALFYSKNDIINSLTFLTIHLSTLFLFFIISLILVARIIINNREISGLNLTLENYVIENSLLAHKLDRTSKSIKKKKNSISYNAEEKVKKAINIIDEQYLAVFDRAQLAEVIGVHPDNLSKHFKKFTGKKMIDYVYELKVNEAAKRLRETDENIIDIAFAVGFESLRTFNRIFPKVMGVTPIKYRKKGEYSKSEE